MYKEGRSFKQSFTGEFTGDTISKGLLKRAYEATRFDEVASRLKVDTVKALRIMEYIMPVLLFIMNMSLLAVLWFGTKQIATGTTPLGDIVAIVNYAMRMTGSFSMFAFIIIFYARKGICRTYGRNPFR